MDDVGGAGREAPRVLATGWTGVDAALAGGLRYGTLHEWLGVDAAEPDSAQQRLSDWRPPLSVLLHLARQALAHTPESAGVFWIGRRVWPYGHALLASGAALCRASVFVDAPDAQQRFWAVDVALRHRGASLVVIADASGLKLALSRRWQLAAEAGGSLALLARPPWEQRELSAASTRWRVLAEPGESSCPRWKTELVRCKGSHTHTTHARSWTIERRSDARVVSLSPELGDRPTAAALAS